MSMPIAAVYIFLQILTSKCIYSLAGGHSPSQHLLLLASPSTYDYIYLHILHLTHRICVTMYNICSNCVIYAYYNMNIYIYTHVYIHDMCMCIPINWLTGRALRYFALPGLDVGCERSFDVGAPNNDDGDCDGTSNHYTMVILLYHQQLCYDDKHDYIYYLVYYWWFVLWW